jgi:hypothetical protein
MSDNEELKVTVVKLMWLAEVRCGDCRVTLKEVAGSNGEWIIEGMEFLPAMDWEAARDYAVEFARNHA